MTVWFEPVELIQPLPRKVRLKKVQKTTLKIVVGVFAAPAILILIGVYFLSAKMENLKQQGFETHGVVDQLRVTRSRSNVNYLVDYSFYVSTSQRQPKTSLHGTSPLYLSDFSKLSVGELVEIIYLPTKPEISALKISLNSVWSDPWGILYTEFIMIGGVFGGIILLITGNTWYIFIRQRHLARWGNACPAQITAERNVSGQFGQKIELTYQFQDESGRVVQGTRKGLPNRKELSRPRFAAFDAKIRKNPTVLYDPNRPSRNLLYPPAMVDFVGMGSDDDPAKT